MKGIIYYTDNKIGEPICSKVRECISASGLPIVSVSLEPIDFGHNVVYEGKRGYISYINQILTALETSTADYVFFCEHDVLYPLGHFDFTPPRDDIYYYNEHVLKWEYGADYAISYKRMISLSCLCVNREFALEQYRARIRRMEKKGLDRFKSRDPQLARRWGYEPGAKRTKRGGFSDDTFDTWHSEHPVIDIRHKGTFSPLKVKLGSFKHAPVDWKEIPIEDIMGWHLQELL